MGMRLSPACFTLLCSLLLPLLSAPALRAQDFWKQAAGPYGGDVRCLARTPSGVLVAGTSDGIYTSADNGATWVPRRIGLPESDIRALLSAPSGLLLAGSGGHGVFSSADDGATWLQTDTTLDELWIGSFTVGAGGALYAGTSQGVYRSVDNGGTWLHCGSLSDYIQSLSVTAGGAIYAGTYYNGVQVSLNNGANWTKVYQFGPVYATAISAGGTLFAAPWARGVVRSTNDGGNWTIVRTGMEKRYIFSLLFADAGHLLAGTDSGLYVTTDLGTLWTPLLLPGHTVTALLGAGGDTVRIGTAGAGAVGLTLGNGPIYAPMTGMLNTPVWNVGAAPNGAVFAATKGGVFSTGDTGATWTSRSAGLGTMDILSFAAAPNGTLYTGTRLGIFRSIDNGNVWERSGGPLITKEVTDIACDSMSRAFCTSQEGIYRTVDNGGSWEHLTADIGSRWIRNVTAAPNGTMYLVTDDTVYLSTSAGAGWSKLPTMPVGNVYYSSIRTNAQGHLFLGATGYGAVYRSIDGGASWTTLFGGPASPVPWCLDINARGHILAGCDSGVVLRSTDDGATWTETTPRIGASRVMSIATDRDGYAWAGTERNAMFRSMSSAYPPPVPAVPLLQSPLNDATDVPVAAPLAWKASSGATAYHAQVSALQTFTTTAFDRAGLSAASVTASGLSTNTRYYWRVEALNAAGTSGWSQVRSFTTIPALPAMPSLASPTNGASDVPLPVELRWTAATGAASYEAQVSASPLFSPAVFDRSGISGLSQQVPVLQSGMRYYWRVRASNAAGTGGWSDTWSFTTLAGLPGAPRLSSPANGSANVSNAPAFSWEAVAGALTYGVEVSTDSSFSAIAKEQAGLTGLTYTAEGLQDGVTYYWHVNAANAAGTGPWSEAWSFSTAATKPAAPVLVSPADGTTGITEPVQLAWSHTGSGMQFALQVSTSPLFTPLLKDTTTGGTTKMLTGLAAETKHYWRVNASAGSLVSDWSTVWSFTTGDATSAERPASAADFIIGEPYPNPAASSAAVAVTLQRDRRVSITVHDALGRTVGRLRDDRLPPGTHLISWGVSSLPPGIYTLRVASDAASATRRFAVVR